MQNTNFLFFDTPLMVLATFSGWGGSEFYWKSYKIQHKILLKNRCVLNSIFDGFLVDFGSKLGAKMESKSI